MSHKTHTLAYVVGFITTIASVASAEPFATEALEYVPAPGQFTNHPSFNDPARALGAPAGGGTLAADNSKVVSLGGFGGSITLAFDHRVLDDSRNHLGLDAIVFSNCFWASGDPNVKSAELAVIEISLDVNGNGLADDQWYVIPGSHLSDPPMSDFRSQLWDDDGGTSTPPANLSWYPDAGEYPELAGSYSSGAYELPEAFAANEITNPLGKMSTQEGIRGYAENTPTMILGDLSGAFGSAGDDALDDPEDRPGIAPEIFYTWPDDPVEVGVSRGSGGGDAFDIAWAVHPDTGAPANLPGFDFIRVRTSVDGVIGPGGILGELSAEIAGVADVRPMGDLTGDGVVSAPDIAELISRWGSADVIADLDGDGAVGAIDLAILLGNWG